MEGYIAKLIRRCLHKSLDGRKKGGTDGRTDRQTDIRQMTIYFDTGVSTTSMGAQTLHFHIA